jgi:hypothetical protein
VVAEEFAVVLDAPSPTGVGWDCAVRCRQFKIDRTGNRSTIGCPVPQLTPSESIPFPPLHLGVNAAIAAALIAAGIAMVVLNVSVQQTQLGTIGTLSFLASGVVLFLS